jgi:predicted esterase
LIAALLMCASVSAQESPTTARVTTIAALFPAEEAATLAGTLPVDRQVRFRVRECNAPPCGVLVFVSSMDKGELPPQWAAVLDEKHVTWIAADEFGNSRPTAERMLVAVMALKLAPKLHGVDARRIYISGMSGGGRVASKLIAHFPELFAGAVYMAGADYYMPAEATLSGLLGTRGMVFVTGGRDFNHREMRSVRDRYRAAGVARILWLDQPDAGHQPATAAQLAVALDFLDAR